MAERSARSIDRKAGRDDRTVMERVGVDPRFLGMVGALVVIWILFNIATGGTFLSARNLWNLAVQTSVVGIIATGMVFVIVMRQIDLSVGSLLGFAGMVMAVLQVSVFPLGAEWAWLATLLLGLLVGALAGLFQGWWIAYQAVPSFIVTLAGLLIFRGGAWLLTQGRTVAPLDPTFQILGGGLNGAIGATWSWIVGGAAIVAILWLAYRSRAKRARLGFDIRPLWAELLVTGLAVGLVVAFVLTMNAYTMPRSDVPRGIPVPVLIMLGVAIVMTFIARATKFGRYVYAIGGSPEAAKLAGIDTRRVMLMVFMIIGMLSALAGAVAAARLNAGANATGTLAELQVIAAAVIGGTSLAGGVGTVAGAIVGAVIMQSLQNGMVLLGLTSALQQVVIGLALILAVWSDVAYRRRRGVAE